jgi:uncharacterized protein
MARAFLTARWEALLLLNYAVPAEVLLPRVPAGTELDLWQGRALCSVVGFRFARTRLGGIPVPFHINFEEVNLRFYVKRTVNGELRRAVVFVRELVPRWAIATVARWCYNEPYLAVPMSHRVDLDEARGGSVEYRWRHAGVPFCLSAHAHGPAQALIPGSEAEFITEHYWGYTAQRDGGTLEYRVEHPPWRVWDAADARFTGESSALYGAEFAPLLSAAPQSAFIALGSDVAVNVGVRI